MDEGLNHPHIEAQPNPLIHETYDDKLDKYFVKFKLRRYPQSSTLDFYEFKRSFLENSEPQKFLLFVHNFNMNLAMSGMLEAGDKVQYLCTLVCVEGLRQFDQLSADLESTQPLNNKDIIQSLAH